tara:strand:+ start:281 stop:559 length:279 start_codon:yes stop_codon:yes gene_type:complete
MWNFIYSFENLGVAYLFILPVAIFVIWLVSKLIKFVPDNYDDAPLGAKVVLKLSEMFLMALFLFSVFWVIRTAGYLVLAGGIFEVILYLYNL